MRVHFLVPDQLLHQIVRRSFDGQFLLLLSMGGLALLSNDLIDAFELSSLLLLFLLLKLDSGFFGNGLDISIGRLLPSLQVNLIALF